MKNSTLFFYFIGFIISLAVIALIGYVAIFATEIFLTILSAIFITYLMFCAVDYSDGSPVVISEKYNIFWLMDNKLPQLIKNKKDPK